MGYHAVASGSGEISIIFMGWPHCQGLRTWEAVFSFSLQGSPRIRRCGEAPNYSRRHCQTRPSEIRLKLKQPYAEEVYYSHWEKWEGNRLLQGFICCSTLAETRFIQTCSTIPGGLIVERGVLRNAPLQLVLLTLLQLPLKLVLADPPVIFLLSFAPHQWTGKGEWK